MGMDHWKKRHNYMQRKNIYTSYFTSNKAFNENIKTKMLEDAKGSNLKITFISLYRFKVTRLK